MRSSTLLLASLAGVLAHPTAEKLTSRAVDASTLQGKYLFGYQAWFRSPGPGINTHWGPAGIPAPGSVEFDFWPDVTGYPSACLLDTNFTLPNGKVAQVYDNTCEGVVDLHFQWLQENDLDGMLLQRFYGSMNDTSFLTILDQAQAAAEKYGRVFAVEYDLSGANSADYSVTNGVINDFDAHIKAYTESSAYVKQDGKPYIQIYGPGVVGRTVSVDDSYDLVRDLKNLGVYVGVSPSNNWGDDVRGNTGFVNVYKEADVISPWTVGSYHMSNYESYFNDLVVPDNALAASIGVNYCPVIWDGTSAYHIHDVMADFDYFPRYNGTFYQEQAAAVITLNPRPFFIKQAMFDEVDEGSQVYPCLKVEDLPTEDLFVGYDNDFSSTSKYLQLAGTAAANYRAAL